MRIALCFLLAIASLGSVGTAAADAGATPGAITEFPVPTPASGPSGIAAGPDGALWFTESQPAANKIGRITTTGSVTEFALHAGPALGITAGPDGAMWFTQEDVIGRISMAGTVQEFPIPTPNAGAQRITAGPDGALWFTEGGGDKIGRITTSGHVTEFALPAPPFHYLAGITAGRDGALWFTEGGGGTIGRITTSGQVTEFRTGRGAEAITGGPDGALWFTEPTGVGSEPGVIGRITTGGVMTTFPLGAPALEMFGITAGRDGALWFIEGFTPSRIGRITTGGAITELDPPTPNSGPEGIAAGPDGAVWFTEQATNKIGRIALASSVATEKRQCKHGGWRHVVDDRGHRFRSQGQCLRFVTHHRRKDRHHDE